jgi:nitrogen regulatory protein P-II 1
MSEIIYLTDAAVITCIVNKERSEAVLIAAREMGATAAVIHTVQGWGIRERLGAWGVASETEKDYIVFLVSSDQQELIFETIYRAADMDAPGRGVMFISPVDKIATYVPEAIRKQLDVSLE